MQKTLRHEAPWRNAQFFYVTMSTQYLSISESWQIVVKPRLKKVKSLQNNILLYNFNFQRFDFLTWGSTYSL